MLSYLALPSTEAIHNKPISLTTNDQAGVQPKLVNSTLLLKVLRWKYEYYIPLRL